jgi:hypothetical protein
MNYWSWWMGGVALAGVVLLHWFTLGRQLAVSGRFTAIVNRLRFGAPLTTSASVTQAEMIAAMQAATAEAFGDEAVNEPEEGTSSAEVVAVPSRGEKPLARELPALTAGLHLVFLASLVAGGAVSALLADGDIVWTAGGLRSSSFPEIFGESSWMSRGVLIFGGVLVGFGTRMSSGCTSGHGLCGVSRARPAGLLATACFFGAGIAVSFLLRSFT